MKVTVKDCLQLESFRKCIVVAGERSTDNRVKSVSVMDATESGRSCKMQWASGCYGAYYLCRDA